MIAAAIMWFFIGIIVGMFVTIIAVIHIGDPDINAELESIQARRLELAREKLEFDRAKRKLAITEFEIRLLRLIRRNKKLTVVVQSKVKEGVSDNPKSEEL